MKTVVVILVILASLGSLWAIYKGFFYLMRWLLYELAQENILFTLRREGEIKAIMKGDTCHKYVMAVDNYRIDPDDLDLFKGSFENYAAQLVEKRDEKRRADRGFVDEKLIDITNEKLTTEETLIKYKMRAVEGKIDIDKKRKFVLEPGFVERINKANEPTKPEKKWGVVWVGFPPYHVFSYKFKWIKYDRDEKSSEGSTNRMIPRTKNVDSLYFSYSVYGLTIDDAETGAGSIAGVRTVAKPGGGGEESEIPEKIGVKLDLVFETETTNPQKTLFRIGGLSSAGNWIIAVSAEIKTAMRSWVGNRTYDTLLHITKEEEHGHGSIKIKGLLDEVIKKINEKIKPDYGQILKTIRIVNIDLKDGKLQTAIDTVFNERQALNAATLTAEKDVRLARGKQALAAAPLLGQAQGLKAIKDGGGEKMYVSEQVGKIHVYAPADKGNLLINVPTEEPGAKEKKEKPPEKPENPTLEDSHKKKK